MKIVNVVKINVDMEMEDDGRWIAEIPEMPGVMVYGKTHKEAIKNLKGLAVEVLKGMIDEATERYA